jgi:hypothetical protein
MSPGTAHDHRRLPVSARVPFLGVIFLLHSLPAAAVTVFGAALDGSHVVPPVATNATAEVQLFLSDDETRVSYFLTDTSGVVFNPLTQVAVFGPATPGQNGPVLDSVVVCCGIDNAFLVGADQVADLRAGLWYAALGPLGVPGEPGFGASIRGQVSAVPESRALALFAVGVLLIQGLGRRPVR